MTTTLPFRGKRLSKLAASTTTIAALAAPLHASAAGPTVGLEASKSKTSSLDCSALIASAKSATSRHGMDVESASKTSLEAVSPTASFRLTCSPKFALVNVSDPSGGETEIEISSGEISTISIVADFSSGAFLSKEFTFDKHGEGTQEHFAISSWGTAAAMSSPIIAKDPSKSEFTVSFGTPARVNREFMVSDIQAEHWTVATDLQMAWSGLDEAMEKEGGKDTQARTALFAYQARPLPANDTQDGDHGTTNKTCVAGAAACVAGLIGIITAGACAAGAVACLAAAACEAADCSGDGYN